MSDDLRPRPWIVRDVHRETGDTVTLDLIDPDDGEGMPFGPGQFNMLYLFGLGEVPISISGDPARPQVLTHTVRAVGEVTRPMAALAPSDTIGVRGPFGSAWPLEQARGQDVVIVAGGIGLAPLRPALLALLADRDAHERIILLYGARSPEELLYGRQLHDWRGRFDLSVRVTVDRAGPDWHGHVGVVTTLFSGLELDPERTVGWICGPEVMMRFTASEFLRRGLGEERIWVSMERNMKCAVGWCGHCQLGPHFICKDGPVLRLDRLGRWFRGREL